MNKQEYDCEYETTLYDLCSSTTPGLEIRVKADIEKYKRKLYYYATNKYITVSDKQWRYALDCLKNSTRLLSEITNNPEDKAIAIKINSLTLKKLTQTINEKENSIEELITQMLYPTNTTHTKKDKINITFDKSIIDNFKACEVSVKTEKGKEKIILSFSK